ncbi:MAG: hypothetical protein LBT14_03335 [Treponema sp.]|jgi:hypothetical protein|nr:hypothetical protein [Treponema sp.]
MHNRRIDNSRLEEKVRMRAEKVKDGNRILDCYHGNGIIWGQISAKKKIEVIGIEREKGKGSIALYGECEKIIPRLDLSGFNIIDCDSWGIPFIALQKIFQNTTLTKDTVIFYTFTQTSLSRCPNDLIACVGISKDMIKKCPTLFSGIYFEAFKEFLRRNGIKEIYDSYSDGPSRKHYGWFIYA